MVDVDTIKCLLSVYSGRLTAQVDWIGPKVGSHQALLCIHQKNGVNSRNDCQTMTATNTLSLLLLHGEA